MVTFNGKSSDDYGIHIEKISDYSVPEKDYDITHVPGKSGDVLIDNGSYKNVELKYEVSLGDYTSTFSELKTRIIQWIYPSSGYCRLEDDDDPGFYRMAVYKDSFDITPVLSHGARASLIFNAKPQRFRVDGDTETSQIGSILNPTGFESFPIISVTGAGTIKIYHNDSNSGSANRKLYCELDIEGDQAGSNGYVDCVETLKANAYDSFGDTAQMQKAVYDVTNHLLTIVGSFTGKASVYTVNGSSVTFLQTLTHDGKPITGEILGATVFPQSLGNFLLICGNFGATGVLIYKYESGRYVEKNYITRHLPVVEYRTITPLDNTRALITTNTKYVYALYYNGSVWAINTTGLDVGGVPSVAESLGSSYAIIGGSFGASYCKVIHNSGSTLSISYTYTTTQIPGQVLNLSVSKFVDDSQNTYYLMAMLLANPSGSTFKLYNIQGNTFSSLMNMSYSGLDALSGRETLVKITNSYVPYTTGGNPQFRLIVTGSFANTAAYYVGDLNTTSFGVVFTFKDYIPESPSGASYAMPPTGCVFINDTGYTYEDADFVLIGSDVNKANLFHINAESAVLPRQLIVVSELADAYSIQNGQVVNKNFAVYFVDGIVPKMGPRYTEFETVGNITQIGVKPKWWTL